MNQEVKSGVITEHIKPEENAGWSAAPSSLRSSPYLPTDSSTKMNHVSQGDGANVVSESTLIRVLHFKMFIHPLPNLVYTQIKLRQLL